MLNTDRWTLREVHRSSRPPQSDLRSIVIVFTKAAYLVASGSA